jgi:hypothetical protein
MVGSVGLGRHRFRDWFRPEAAEPSPPSSADLSGRPADDPLAQPPEWPTSPHSDKKGQAAPQNG